MKEVGWCLGKCSRGGISGGPEARSSNGSKKRWEGGYYR